MWSHLKLVIFVQLKKQLLAVVLLAMGASAVCAQDTAATTQAKTLTFSGFTEVYYGFDAGQPTTNKRPPFVYSHNRHNEVNVNLAYLKGSYATQRVRATVAMGIGTYMNANYATEEGVFKNVYEANVGVRISRNKNLYLDAGVMPSHLGFESAQSSDCWTLTRSIIADNSPYYESGAKLGYQTDNGKWYLSGLVLNGWQRIQRADGNSTLSGGTQVTYKPSSTVQLNYSTFLGNNRPDSARRTRFFHNAYAILQLSRQWGLIAGLDYGMEQSRATGRLWDGWLGSAIIVRYQPKAQVAMALRAEYYQDRHGVIIATGTPNGFSTAGLSANFDLYIAKNVLWRVETKALNSNDALFTDQRSIATNVNFVATTSLAISFK